MQLEIDTANEFAQWVADKLTGGRVDVYDAAETLLASCPFAAAAFAPPEEGAIHARPFPPAIALADGKPSRFSAFDKAGTLRLQGSAGFKTDEPTPEMAFKTRQIIEGADVLVESFVFSVVAKPPSESTD